MDIDTDRKTERQIEGQADKRKSKAKIMKGRETDKKMD
jgi:hypothetical protein